MASIMINSMPTFHRHIQAGIFFSVQCRGL